MKTLKLLTLAILPLTAAAQHDPSHVSGSIAGLVANSGKVIIQASTFVDSYDSTLGYYGRGNVNANASAVAFDAVEIDPSAAYQGSSKGLAANDLRLVNFPVPEGLTSLGDYEVAEGDMVSLRGGDYLFDSFTLGAEAYLQLQGEVRIWVLGAVTIQGEVEGPNGNPNDFWVFGTDSTSSVNIIGDASVLMGHVYAPTASVVINQAEVYGSLTGRDILLMPGSAMHYDEATPPLAASMRAAAPAAFAAPVVAIRPETMTLGPVPSNVNEPICLFSPKPTTRTDWTVYNVAGERVASLDFGSETSQCWTPSGLSAGVYLVHIAADYFDGSATAQTRKVVVRN